MGWVGPGPEWIADISEFFNATSTFGFVNIYFKDNPEADPGAVEKEYRAFGRHQERADRYYFTG